MGCSTPLYRSFHASTILLWDQKFQNLAPTLTLRTSSVGKVVCVSAFERGPLAELLRYAIRLSYMGTPLNLAHDDEKQRFVMFVQESVDEAERKSMSPEFKPYSLG